MKIGPVEFLFLNNAGEPCAADEASSIQLDPGTTAVKINGEWVERLMSSGRNVQRWNLANENVIEVHGELPFYFKRKV